MRSAPPGQRRLLRYTALAHHGCEIDEQTRPFAATSTSASGTPAAVHGSASAPCACSRDRSHWRSRCAARATPTASWLGSGTNNSRAASRRAKLRNASASRSSGDGSRNAASRSASLANTSSSRVIGCNTITPSPLPDRGIIFRAENAQRVHRHLHDASHHHVLPGSRKAGARLNTNTEGAAAASCIDSVKPKMTPGESRRPISAKRPSR